MDKSVKKDIDKFLTQPTKTLDPSIQRILERIWAHNDALSSYNAEGYKSREATIRFLKARGFVCGRDFLESCARRAGRKSWTVK